MGGAPAAVPVDPMGPTSDPRLRMCEGGFAGLFMMSGNVWEWEDACDGQGSCVVRGGGFDSPQGQLTCSSAVPVAMVGGREQNIGFRCCTNF
jgi:formylglycine-generating enzyme required for sulfatase activity